MIRKETIHPEGDNSVDIYPKTSFDQVEGRPDMSEYQLKSRLESDIEEFGFSKVVGNISEEGTIDLVKIKIGNTVYLVPQGTVVEANPAETGLTNLTKIKIGSTVYNIPSGGKLYSHEIQFAWSDNFFAVCFDSPSMTPINSAYAFMALFNMESRSIHLRVNYIGANNDAFVGLVTSLYGSVGIDNSNGTIYVTISAGTATKSISCTWETAASSPYVTDTVSEW